MMISDKHHMYTNASVFAHPELSGDEGHKALVYNRRSCSLLARLRYLWSLQRRDMAEVLWMDNRAEDGRAAGRSVLCSDQALEMPRHCVPGDKHLRSVPSSLTCFQSDPKGPFSSLIPFQCATLGLWVLYFLVCQRLGYTSFHFY